MPTYRVTDKVSGVTLDLTGDSPPTEQELADIFSKTQAPAPQPQSPEVGPIENAVGKFGRAVGSSIASVPKSVAIFGDALADFTESHGLGRGGQPEQVSDALTYKLGKLVSDSFDEMFAVNTTGKETFLGDTLPSAAGSMAGFMLGGVAGKALKIPAALTVAMTGAAAGGVEGFEDAKQAGGSEDQQWVSFLANAGLGATEAIPIAGWLNRVNKASGGKLRSAIVSGAEETAQEIFQQVGGNLTASKIAGYDPQRPWSQGVVEGGGAGLTLGTLGGFLFGKRARPNKVNALTPDATDSGITEPVRPDETFDIRNLAAKPEAPVTTQPPVVEAKPEPVRTKMVAAAFRTKNGETFSGIDHMDAAMKADELGIKVDESMAGFLDKEGKFYTREEADRAATNKRASDDFAPGQLHTGKLATPFKEQASPPVVEAKPEPVVSEAVKPAAEPEPIGMGGATPAEFAPPQKFTTGNKNATVDAELKKMGLPPLMEVERKSNQSAWDEAMQKIDENPKEQDDLISELKEQTRAATPVENAMLLHRRIDLKNEYNKATARWREAFESGDLVRAAEEAQRANGWRNQIADLSDITKSVGTEAGRDLQARKMMANEEFNLAAMETEMMMRKGRNLTPQERLELMQAHDKIKELQNKLDELESGKEAKEVSTEIDKQIKDISTKTSKDTAVDREETILAGIKKKVDGGNQAQITPLVQKLARVFWMRGVRGREPMIDALHDALKTIVPDLTREETQRAFSGYGNYKPLSKAEIDVGLRDLRGQTQQMLKIKAIEERKPLEKTGVERRELSDEERRLVKQVNELKRKYGVVVTDPATQLKSALQARKTYVEHRMADLKYEIETRQRIVKTKTPSPRDAELDRMMLEYEAIKAEHESVFGSREMTDAQRLKLAIAAAERNQAYWEATLEGAKKGIFSKKVAGRKVTSAELEVIKARTETLKAQVEELKSLDAELQSAEQIKRLEESIAEYERKIAAGEFTSAKKEGVTNPAIEALAAKRDALRQTLQDLREKSAPYIASKIAKAEKALDESIAETVRQINEGDIEARKPNPKISTPEIEAKRAELEELQRIRRELRNAAKPRRSPQEIALQALKSRMMNQQEKLLQRILDRDFDVKKREPVPMDAEARAIKAELDIVKQEYQDELDRATWEKMSIFQKSKRSAADTYDAARALMTTGELSFILRQAKFTTLSHPILTAKALPDMFRALLSSEKKAHEVDLKTHTHPDADAARAAKLHLVEEGVSLHRQEEMMMGRWTGKIPVVKNFNRAAQVFLNKIRFDTWRAMRKSLSKTGTPTALEDKQIAMFVNEATGRGGLGKLEAAAVPLARIMFSPRYFASRLELVAGHSMWGGTMRTRKIIAAEYARSLIGLGLYYTLLSAYFGSGDDDNKDAGRIEIDPKSGDFGKVIVGKTRVDPLAGLAQVITFAARTATGEKKSRTGKVTPIRGEKVPYGGDKWSDVALDFGRGKLHPVPAAIANLFDGTDMGGNQATIMNQAENMISPITYVDVYRALKEQDLDDATVMSLLALLGEGLQTYQKPKKETP